MENAARDERGEEEMDVIRGDATLRGRRVNKNDTRDRIGKS